MKTNLSIFLFLIAIFFPCLIIAQSKYEVKSGKELENIFYSEKSKYEDTLSLHVKQSGIIFIRFKINKDGILDSLLCSERHPKVLIYVATKILNSIKIVSVDKVQDSRFYILPLLYNYQPEFKPPTTLADLKNQIPDFDVNDWMSYMNLDFNGLFNVPESQKNLWGMECVLLPMIRIFRPMVFDKDNPWQIKSKKQD